MSGVRPPTWLAGTWPRQVKGAAGVLGSIVSAPRLGAVTLVALIVAGQAIASLVVDHFGWVGFEAHPIGLGRIAGVLFLAAGVALVRIF